ncbi:MAG: hypothetical protein IT504_02390 [Burkholderiaceae bacterium]|nr:hypothetical protein [Burkholderiaceae bacterium]
MPGRHRTLFWLAPAGVRRFIASCPSAQRVILRRFRSRLAREGSAVSSLGAGRVVSVPLP